MNSNQAAHMVLDFKDTATKDQAGKGIVHIYAGAKWGWQMRPAQPS